MPFNENHRYTLISAKFFAAIMIVTAHCFAVPSSFSAISQDVSSAMKLFSRSGVAIFFFISGYLFAFNKHSTIPFWKKKVKTLLVPWMFTGSIVYLYVALRKQGVDLVDWLLWVGGVKTYLWYMTVLVALYALFMLLARYKAFLVVVPILSLISYVTYSLTYPYLWSWSGDYLNVFSWSLFFWAGYMISKHQRFDALLNVACQYRLWWLCLYGVIVLLFVMLNVPCDYGMPQYLPFAVLSILVTFSLAVPLRDHRIVKNIGTDSFAIYLLHMPLAGIVSNLCNRVDSAIFLIIRPIVIIAVLETALSLLRGLVKRYPKLGFMNTLIGTR